MIIDEHISFSEEETIKLGEEFAKELNLGDIVLFHGELGAGKTEFIKGICTHFEVEEIVSSPTFTVINQYEGSFNGEDFPIYHIDLYRINSNEELDSIGFKECLFSDNGIKLIEWAEKAAEVIPDDCITVTIKTKDDNEDARIIQISKNIAAS